MDAKRKLFEKIAREHLLVRTLEPRGRDSLDFHEIGVHGIASALDAAYEAGRQSASCPYRDESELSENLREQLSPHAVAAIVAYLQPAMSSRNAEVNRELDWFSDVLVQLLGGPESYQRITDELGLW